MCSCPSPYQLMTFRRHSIIPQDTRASTPTGRTNHLCISFQIYQIWPPEIECKKSLTILVAGQVIQEGKQGSGIFLWERCQQRICPKVKNNQYVSTKFKKIFFYQIEHVIQISEFSYISEEIKMVYPSCAGYMNVQAPEETRDRTRLQLHQLCYSI